MIQIEGKSGKIREGNTASTIRNGPETAHGPAKYTRPMLQCTVNFAAPAFAGRVSCQMAACGSSGVPSVKRAWRKPEMSSDGWPSAISSAHSRPAMGPMPKP